jgi:hypothetical protein
MASKLLRSGYIISNKSTIVASTRRIAKRIQERRAQQHIEVKIGDHCRDFGRDYAGGNNIRVCVGRQRLNLALARGRRVARLVGINRKASKLHLMEVVPQALWGASVMGMAPTRIRKLRTSAARCTGDWKEGRCTTSVLAINGLQKLP